MNIVVIGGGAAGIMAANTAASHGAHVTILEHKDRVGKKILATGNGKCNLSNLSFSWDNYFTDSENGEERIKEVFQQFDVAKTLEYFHSIGLWTKERDGYVYPFSEQASVVLDLLRNELEFQKVEIRTEIIVKKVFFSSETEQFQINTDKGDFSCDSVIFACGGMASPVSGSDGSGFGLIESLGHHILTPVPALVQLRCKEKFFRQISGVRCDALISLNLDRKIVIEERGELQLTDYGISGIPVFQLSRHVARYLEHHNSCVATIDFLPDISKEALKEQLIARLSRFKTECATVEQFVTGLLNKKVMNLVISQSGLSLTDECCRITEQKLILFVSQIKELQVTVTETNSFVQAQVSAGGIDLQEVTKHLESKRQKGVFFAGEMLDVDGKCGGYNLQWAWSSGYVAGKEAATKETTTTEATI